MLHSSRRGTPRTLESIYRYSTLSAFTSIAGTAHFVGGGVSFHEILFGSHNGERHKEKATMKYGCEAMSPVINADEKPWLA